MFSEKRGYKPDGESQENAIGKTREVVSSIVNESSLPTKDYESTVGIFGGKLKEDQEGRLVYDMTGLVSNADQFGDAVLRTYDEHIMREPLKVLKNHPKWFFKFLAAGTKRYRGKPEEIIQNVDKLGLSEYYGLHPDGIEIKKPELYTDGIALQDIYRADQIGSEKLKDLDRFEALTETAQYVRDIHQRGGIGELLSSDIIFQKKEGAKAVEPLLNLPDIVYNQELKKKVSIKEQSLEARERDQKATDVLDFLFHIGVEELRRSEDWEEVGRAMSTFIDNYDQEDVIKWIKSFAKRGRLTLVGDKEVLGESKQPDVMMVKAEKVLVQHNKARLSTSTDIEGKLRSLVIRSCEKYLNK